MIARFERELRIAWRAVLVTVVTLAAFRLALLVAYRPAAFGPPPGDLWRGFLMGARFDLKIAAITFGGAAALSLPGLALGARAPRWLLALPGAVAIAALLAIDLTALVNHFYYGFYHRPVDVLVFGLLEDDTTAVLSTVLRDYPLVRGVLGLVVLVAAQAWIVLRVAVAAARAPRWRVILALLAVCGLLLAGRGSLGVFPLREADLAVSRDRFVNDLVPCGLQALFLAVRERNATRLGRDVLTGLKRLGFRSPLEAAAAAGIPARDEAELLERLYPAAPPAPAAAARPPHVVVALMESWGDDLLSFHGPGNDLLGRLAPHLDHGLLFRRFAAVMYGTDGTLEALLLSTPVIPLLFSAYADRTYDTAVTLPYKARGYRTVFLTSSSGGWRNLNRALPRQGFDEVLDMADLQAAYPGAPALTWGTWDDYLFRDAARRPLDLGAFRGERVAADPVLARSILETYQYACDGLGGLLDEIEGSTLADHTILAATGAHNLRTFFDYAGEDRIPRKYGVPLLIHAPAAYLAGRAPDTSRWAGHRDLFPTLASLALPGARIFASGRDLTAPVDRPTRALVDYRVVIGDEGVVPDLGKPQGSCGRTARSSPAPTRPARARSSGPPWRSGRTPACSTGTSGGRRSPRPAVRRPLADEETAPGVATRVAVTAAAGHDGRAGRAPRARAPSR